MKPLEIKKKGMEIGKNTIVSVSLAVLIGLGRFVFHLGTNYTTIENRIERLEEWKSQGGRFTAQDGDVLSDKIKDLQEEKADKSDIKIIEVKLANIETVLLEIKQKIK